MPDATAANQSEYGNANPWLVAILVSVATFMEVLDTTIANVALRYIAGGLGVSSDEASWAITTYLVANSIVLCASGWLARCSAARTSSWSASRCSRSARCCAASPGTCRRCCSSGSIQGLAGGGMTPVAQSILAAAFPPEKRGQGFALYGIAVVVAPVVGPTLGGWLSDNCLLALVLPDQRAGRPDLAGARSISSFPSPPKQRRSAPSSGPRVSNFDIVGFLLVAMFLGALEVVLDRGQIDDWFGSQLHRRPSPRSRPCRSCCSSPGSSTASSR